MKWLITGASGLLGSTGLMELSEKNHVLGLYLHHPILPSFCETIQVDLRDPPTVERIFFDFRPDFVLHCAAAVNIDECEENPSLAFSLNTAATGHLAKLAAQFNSKFIYVSTDAFFTGDQTFFSELDLPKPISIYAKSKLAGEEVVRAALDNHLILRTNIYGWNFQPKLSFAEWILNTLRSNARIQLVSDVYYTPILTHSFIRAAELLAISNHRGTFHIGSDRRLSKLEFGILIAKTFNLDASLIDTISIHSLGLPAKRSTNMALEISKLKAALPGREFNVERDLQLMLNLEKLGYPSALRTGRPFAIPTAQRGI